MRSFRVKPVSRVKGEITLLGDKSIAHRSIIISAISKGPTTIENFPTNKDCLYTIKAFKRLGIKIIQGFKNIITIYGKGHYGLTEPKGAIFVGDSGTTFRLLLGVLAGQSFKAKLTAGKSLLHRPMLRVTEPLRKMGAEIVARHIPNTKYLRPKTKTEEYPPITIKGGNLRPITYKMPVASAQVKSAIILAGLCTKGLTQVIEPIRTRDHTERMLRLFRADIRVKENTISIKGNKELVSPPRIYIPGDISSASFFLVLATILPHSQILIRDVSLNPLRTGIIKVLKRMGADIQATGYRLQASGFEPVGNLIVKSSSLRATFVKKDEIPSLIDELPILMVAACYAQGKTIFEGVSELRVKETDRIRSMSGNLSKMGADIQIRKSKSGKSQRIVIYGIKELKGSRVSSFGDHRTAMSMVIAGLKAKGETLIDDITCIDKSFPNFLNILKTLRQ